MLKIDRAFIDGLDKSEDARTIIRAVIGLGRSLDLKLVAEGVETAAQHRELCSYGCDFIQGYYFYRPKVEADFLEALASQPRSDAPGTQPSLHFLIYASRATALMSAEQVEALVRQSREHNRSAGISGCLVYQDGCFMQMLEGKRETLMALLDKIKGDPRHYEVKLVVEGPARHRVFRDWGMTQRDLSSEFAALDFASWQKRRIDLFELGEDARASYDYITAYAHSV